MGKGRINFWLERVDGRGSKFERIMGLVLDSSDFRSQWDSQVEILNRHLDVQVFSLGE